MKKIILSIASCLAIVLIVTCNSKNENIPTLRHSSKRSTKIGCATDFIAKNNNIIIANFYGYHNIVEVIDFNKGKVKQHLFPRSNTKFSFSSINKLELDNNNIIGYDVTSKQIGIYQGDSLFNKFNSLRIIKLNGKNIYTINKIFKNYLVTGKFKRNKFAIMDSNGSHVLSRFGDYVRKTNSNDEDDIVSAVNYGESMFWSSDSLLVNIVYIGGVVNFYKYNGKGFYLLRQYKINDLNYKTKDGAYINTGVMGFLSLAISSKYVYALYSGKEDSSENSFSEGDILFVFNHKGRLIKKYRLDVPATCITVDNMTGNFFTISQSPNVIINRYDNIDNAINDRNK